MRFAAAVARAGLEIAEPGLAAAAHCSGSLGPGLDVKLRGVISGFGEVAARGHLPGWLSRPGVSIVAIHDPVPERRHLALRQTRNIRVYDRLELMLDGEAPDFVDVASPPPFHTPAVRAALAAGAHVLCEKPLCLRLDELEELAKLAAAKSRTLMCVHNWKQAPVSLAAHQALSSGRLGELRFMTLDRLRTEPAGGEGKWRSAMALGGGILADHGWHVFYLAQWLMGGVAPAWVSAHLGRRETGGVEDLADLRIMFPGERLARVHLSWRAPVRRTYTALCGEKALLEIDGDRVTLTGRLGTAKKLPVDDAPDDSYHPAWFAGVAQEFEQAIAGGPQAVANVWRNLNEARTALKLIAAARESSAAGGIQVGIAP